MRNKIGGVIVAVPTFFRKNEEIDPDALRVHLDFLIKSGVHGICILGSTGEGLYLNRDEQNYVMTVAVDQVNGRVPVLAGTGCMATKPTIELTKVAKDVGVDAAMIVLPTYFPFTREEVYNHYVTVADSVDLPVLLYNFPENSKFNMSPELVADLSRVGGIVGIKDTVIDLSHMFKILELASKDFIVLSGTEAFLAPLLEKGGKGVIGPIANFAPKVVVGLYDAVSSGQASKVNEYVNKISLLLGALTAGPLVSVIKEAIRAIGIDVPTKVRSPLSQASPGQIRKVKNIIAKLMEK
nr:4-hydroxy-tetrahydrodipicolinate synthase [Candidatus Njordarchaeota archaeon]